MLRPVPGLREYTPALEVTRIFYKFERVNLCRRELFCLDTAEGCIFPVIVGPPLALVAAASLGSRGRPSFDRRLSKH